MDLTNLDEIKECVKTAVRGYGSSLDGGMGSFVAKYSDQKDGTVIVCIELVRTDDEIATFTLKKGEDERYIGTDLASSYGRGDMIISAIKDAGLPFEQDNKKLES